MDGIPELEELERRDERVAVALGGADELHARTEAIRDEVRRLSIFQEGLPRERGRCSGAIAAAEERLDAAHVALAEAEQELARTQGRRRERERVAAEHRIAEAREDLRVAGHELERARAAAAALEEEARQAEADEERVAAEAAATATDLRKLPRLAPEAAAPPGRTLADVDEWASRARGALLVVRSSLATERERLVREANELGSALLGESLGVTSVRGVRERLAAR